MSGQRLQPFPVLTHWITDTNQTASEGVMIKFCPKCQCETERYANGGCKPCGRARALKWAASNPEAAKAKGAAWRAANPEKSKAFSAAYRAAHPDRAKASSAAWRAANPDKVKAKGSAYYLANKEYINARNSAWSAANQEKRKACSAAYYAANKEYESVRSAAYRAANPEKNRIREHNRRARKREAGGKLSPDLAAKLFKLQRGKCACCGKPLGNDYHLDHRMPLALGGTNTDDNMQLLRSICNLQKHAKHPVDFMQERGFLL